MEIQQITFEEYNKFLDIARAINPKINLNILPVNDASGTLYLKSNEGISYLLPNGKMGGLARFKKGNEKIAQLHQEFRINLGGNYLECFDGKLVELYGKQGFNVVARLKFDPNFAPNGWQEDKDLKSMPDIVFLSLFDKECFYFNLYEEAEKYAQVNINYLCRRYIAGHDKTNVDRKSITEALKTLNKDLEDVKTVVKWLNQTDIYFNDTKNYIRVSLSDK